VSGEAGVRYCLAFSSHEHRGKKVQPEPRYGVLLPLRKLYFKVFVWLEQNNFLRLTHKKEEEEKMASSSSQVYRSGTLSYTVPQNDVVHMWCDLDLGYRSAASDDWAVCSSVGFSFDRLIPEPLERFAAYMRGAMLEAGPGLFRTVLGRDEDGVPCVECVALPDYRWLVWTNARVEADGLHEWTLWRAEDLAKDKPMLAGPTAP